MQSDNLHSIIVVGYDYKNSVQGLELAKSNENVFCTLGLHPSESRAFSQQKTDEHLKLSQNNKVVAIGEIGLDYHYPDTDKMGQAHSMVAQLELAKAAELPVVIHMRDACEDMRQLLKANKHCLRHGGVMHCYSGSLAAAKEYLDLGLYLSFAGPITYKNAVKYPDIIKGLPIDRILIETDCPYLTPEPFRGRALNEPKNVFYVAKKIAEILNITQEEVEKITLENTFSLFFKLKT